jgi:excisionase family DNA binding protein
MGMETHPSSPRTEIDLMTEQELAHHLKICRRQLYNWRVAGLIPYFKMGKAVRFRVADINEALERMEMEWKWGQCAKIDKMSVTFAHSKPP